MDEIKRFSVRHGLVLDEDPYGTVVRRDKHCEVIDGLAQAITTLSARVAEQEFEVNALLRTNEVLGLQVADSPRIQSLESVAKGLKDVIDDDERIKKEMQGKIFNLENALITEKEYGSLMSRKLEARNIDVGDWSHKAGFFEAIIGIREDEIERLKEILARSGFMNSEQEDPND